MVVGPGPGPGERETAENDQGTRRKVERKVPEVEPFG